MNLRNSRIAITGGAGFIGTHLANYFADNGAEVIAIDIKKQPKSLSSKVKFVNLDVRNQKKLQKYLKNCDIFYNLACDFGGAKYIHENSAHILSYNSEILASTFQAAAKSKVKRIVFPSSSLAYNEKIAGKINEEDLDKYPVTKNSYGFIKLTGEYYCSYFWEQYKLPFTVVRMFNVYGPGDTHTHAVPNFIKQSLKHELPFTIMGDGSETRVFTYVDDIVKGLALAGISKKSINQTFNLSSEKSVTMLELAEKIWKLSGNKEKFIKKLIPIPSSTPLKRSVSSKKVYNLLGWKAVTDFDEGLVKTIEWLKK